MRKQGLFAISIVVALVIAVLPLGRVAIAQDTPFSNLQYDPCTGEYSFDFVAEGMEDPPVLVEVYVPDGDEPLDSDEPIIEPGDDPIQVSGNLAVEVPEGVEELIFRVTLGGEFEERLQVTVDCEVEPPVDDEEPVEEEPVDEEPVDEEPVDEEPIDEEPQIVPGCDTRISLKDAVVGRVLESVPAYWAPDFEKMTSPEVQIPWNSTLWTFGVDESGEFRKVLLECTYLWIPADAMGPNYDEVWNGTPLPMTVVD